MKNSMKIKRGASPLIIILFVLLVLYTLSMLYPLIWAFLTSLKNIDEWFNTNNPNLLPQSFYLGNYATVFDKMVVETNVVGQIPRAVGSAEMLWYTAIYVFGCAFFRTFTPCIVAYVTARFDFKFNKAIYVTVIISLTLPIVGALPSELRISQLLGLWNNPIGLWIMSMTYLGTYYLVFLATFKGIPSAYTEAALVDGAGNTRIFFSIMFPMVKGAFLTVFLLYCIEFWNNYQTPLVYLPSYPTIAVGLYSFKFAGDPMYTEAPYETAGALLVALPIVIVFSIFSDRLMGRISMGGIKE